MGSPSRRGTAVALDFGCAVAVHRAVDCHVAADSTDRGRDRVDRPSASDRGLHGLAVCRRVVAVDRASGASPQCGATLGHLSLESLSM